MAVYGSCSLSSISKCQFSVERRVLELESEGLDSIPTSDNTLLLDILFSHSKASDANVGIICQFRLVCEKPNENRDWLLIASLNYN